MKKLLTILALVAFIGTANAATTTLSTKLNNGLNTLNQKEQALNKKIDNAQAQREAQKQAAAKKQAEQKAAYEKAKAEQQAKIDAQKKAAQETKNAVNEEVSFWKRLFGGK